MKAAPTKIWESYIDYRWLVPGALILALMPWPIGSRPHLIEKIEMLWGGELTAFIDIFDLCWHGWPLALLLVKFGCDLVDSGTRSASSPRGSCERR